MSCGTLKKSGSNNRLHCPLPFHVTKYATRQMSEEKTFGASVEKMMNTQTQRDLSSSPLRQVRANYNETTIRVYQAYSPVIGRAALEKQTFVAPFSFERMTWIKPSFLWMMYRCGWGEKQGQEVVLGIDIKREGFEWALANSCLSHYVPSIHESAEKWRHMLKTSVVRIQWDPERALSLAPLEHRAIQVGLEGKAIRAYVNEWIVRIDDVTPLARQVRDEYRSNGEEAARLLLPTEVEYPLSEAIRQHLGCSLTSATFVRRRL